MYELYDIIKLLDFLWMLEVQIGYFQTGHLPLPYYVLVCDYKNINKLI